MARVNLKVEIKKPWWTEIYIKSCILFSKLFGGEPDPDKMAKLIVKNIKVK